MMAGGTCPSIVGQAATATSRSSTRYEYFEYPASHCVRKNRGVRTERWKLTQYWEQPEEWEMYDLEQDPYHVRTSRTIRGTPVGGVPCRI